ncbi:MAG: LysM peptidoglycan-binding domain-containing protein [Deltaproteobacteria bacterium]|nr:LysM peptidoglycan-binding domain-containing protein [Deltaproteobacteria bacterium]
MSKTRKIGCTIVVFLVLSSIVFAETREMMKHKVVKGDTLWDITEEALSDPFLWPKVWKENPWIADPHWIYPDQVINIPLYLIQRERVGKEGAPATVAPYREQAALPPPRGALKEEAKKDADQITQMTLHPLINKSLFIASGYIADKVPRVGQIIDAPNGQVIFGNDDLANISVDHDARIGQKFYVIKASGPVRHPGTGGVIGYLITIGGIAEITAMNDGEILAKITTCFGPMTIGDLLMTYYEIEAPTIQEPFRSPDISGTIIAGANQMVLQAMQDIIYVDKGSQDGIEIGDIFKTHATANQALPTGIIQVISCRDHTATAMIRSSNQPVSPGHVFTALETK